MIGSLVCVVGIVGIMVFAAWILLSPVDQPPVGDRFPTAPPVIPDDATPFSLRLSARTALSAAAVISHRDLEHTAYLRTFAEHLFDAADRMEGKQ